MVRLDHAVEISELCVLARQPERISHFLRSGYGPAEVKAKLAAERAPPATRRTAAAQSTNDQLAEAIRRRFEAQNRGHQ
jgi:hypothetical protein